MSWLTDLLQGIPLNAVLRERVTLAEQKFKDMEDENKKLAEQVATLVRENESLREQLASYTAKQAVKPKLVGDVYQFEGEEGFFCMNCYDQHGRKARITTLMGRVRQCLACKSLLGC